MSAAGEVSTVADVVIVGSGVAGLSVALGLQGYRVRLLTKTHLGEGSSSIWAQGGVAAALGRGDSPALHARDTLAVGGGIADAEAVSVLTREGPHDLRKLIDIGACFDRHGNQLALGREAAHSQPRIVHAHGDATGAEMVRVLVQAVRRAPWIEVVEATCAEELLVHNGRVVGVLARQGDRWQAYAARAVILATGGLGQVFRYTTNPPEATADGLAMAARAGARLSDIEFVQFHPTALATGNDPMPLLTEALRGEGAILVNRSGHRFMLAAHPEGELAPRDVVARAIWHQLQAGEKVFLDGRTSIGERFPTRFPTVFERCQEHGLDPRHELLPVAPAAHYHMGGIAVDLHGRTSLAGLWACGEVAATGIHGANRLASNSLLEALVFGRRVGEDLSQRLSQRTDAALVPNLALNASGLKLPDNPCSTEPLGGNGAKPGVQLLKQHIRDLMWEKVGLVRTEAGLQETLREFQTLEAQCRPSYGETRNLLTVGRLIATAALLRRESRGAHFRVDYPAGDPHWQRHSVWTAVELDATSFSLAAWEPASTIGAL